MDSWVDEEIRRLQMDKKEKRQNHDTFILIKFLIIIFPLLLYAISLYASTDHEELYLASGAAHQETECYQQEACWRCKKCWRYAWSSSPDWKGDFHCPTCGTKMGEE